MLNSIQHLHSRVTILFFFFAIWTLQAVYLSLHNSPTFDEPVHLEAGMRYLKGDFSYDPIEPPLLRTYVAFLSSHLPTYEPQLLFIPRLIVSVTNGLLLTVLLIIFAPAHLFLAAFLLLTEANIVAHGTIFTTDATSQILVVLFLAGVFRFHSTRFLAFATAFLACIKFVSAIYLFPFIAYQFIRHRSRRFLAYTIITLFLIWAFYGFSSGSPFSGAPSLPGGHFLRLIKENIQFAHRGQPIYFLGTLFLQGPWYKQPLVLLLKTSPIAITLALISLLQKRSYLSTCLVGLIAWVLLVNMATSLHFGIRHLLVVNLALVLLGSQISFAQASTRALIIVSLSLHLLFYAGSLPQPLTYTSPLVSHPYQLLSDSDYDWGQGLVELAAVTRSHTSPFQLAYFGNNNPHKFIASYQRIADASPLSTQPVVPLDYRLDQYISVTCYYYCGYYRDKLLQHKHSRLVAHSFIYFYD